MSRHQVGLPISSGEDGILNDKTCPVRIDEFKTWSFADLLVSRGISRLTHGDPDGEIPFEILVKRLDDFTQIRESYIRSSLPRLLRHPVTPQGIVKGFKFKK